MGCLEVERGIWGKWPGGPFPWPCGPFHKYDLTPSPVIDVRFYL